MANTLEFIIKATDQTSAVVEKIEAKVTGSSKRIGLSLTDIKSGFELAKMAGGMLSGVYDALVGSTMKYAGEVKDLALNLGLTAEETSRLMGVAQKFGVSNETLTNALQMMVKRGLAPSLDGLAAMADEMMAIQDPVKRAAALTDTFGRGWTDLMPILEKGRGGIMAAADEAERLGKVLSQKDVEAVEALEIKMNTLNMKIDGLKTKIGTGLIPVLNDAADGFTYLSDAVSKTDDTEQKLRNAIAMNTLAWGAESSIVKDLSRQMVNYLNRQRELLPVQQALSNNIIVATKAGLNWLNTVTDVNKALDAAVPETNSYAAAAQASARASYEAQQASDANAVALKAYNDAAAAGVIQTGELAQSLMGLGKAAIAKQGIDALKAALDAGTITSGAYEAAVKKVAIAAGLADKASYAAAGGVKELDAMLLAGQITPAQFATAIGKLGQAAKDGRVDMIELGLSMDALHSKEIDLVINTINRTMTDYAREYGAPVPPVPGHSRGANFVVPPGYPNDGYMMRVESGERVIVQTQAQQGAGGGDRYTVNIYDTKAMKMWQEQMRLSKVQQVQRAM